MLPLPVSDRLKYLLEQQQGKPVSIHSSTSLGGGCINNALRISTSSGILFLKYNHAGTFPGMFTSEALGLGLLMNTDTIHVPEVIFSDVAEPFSFLVLEYIETGSRVHNFWESFGRSLAALHRRTTALFGLDHDNYIGSLPQSNRQQSTWLDFFVLERLEPMVRMARNKGEINLQMVSQFESLYPKLERLIPPEVPAMLHGDLWSGNYMVDGKGYP
jgi:fructosamine-3-kinase